jgi:hypothetical protein
MTKLSMIATAATLAFTAPASAATLIDFNTFLAGESVTNQYGSLGVLFSTRTGAAISNAAISVYFPGDGTPDAAVTNSIDGADDRQEFLIITFTTPVSNLSLEYDNYGATYLGDTIKAYGLGGTLLETLSPTPGVADFALETISFTSSGISYVEIQQPSNGWMFAVDNIQFNGGAVPEPASWAMMIAGFGLVGAAMRRRATAVAA